MPETLQSRGFYACLADGSSLTDPLLGDERARSRPIKTDDHFRARICDSYLYYHQTERHPSAEEMIEYRALGTELPRSPGSVFTHGNITPDNIMVDDNNEITGILDWKVAGWYPSYWEYAQIMRAFIPFGDWSVWMDKTATRKWDVSSIEKVRRVLYTYNSTRGNY